MLYQWLFISNHYNYDPDGSDYNFTGYPLYVVSPNADLLLESNDGDYRYTTRVNDGILVTEHSYNSLHLELETKVFTADNLNNRLISHTINTYNGETDDQYFPHFADLPNNYQTPIKIVNKAFNERGDFAPLKSKAILMIMATL
ncbi:MAG: hypothetical protein GBAus27B_000250 [Mycoplasmataceae bacterium]|nr:MAG: hypothetical protein GBAus27B_000250 [Mycoplasmataceae bacterium]